MRGFVVGWVLGLALQRDDFGLRELEELGATEGISSYETEEYYKEEIAFFETLRKRHGIAAPSKAALSSFASTGFGFSVIQHEELTLRSVRDK